MNRKYKAYHNFLQHHQFGRNLSYEARLLEIRRYEVLIHYSVSFDEHGKFFKFHDSDNIVRNFINLFQLMFVPSDKVHIKCTFLIVNFQPAPADGFIEFIDIRVWSTNVYSRVYFNECVKEGIIKYLK